MSHIRTSIAAALLLALTATGLITSLAAQSGATGKLRVDARPWTAGVFVDGKYIGPASNFKRVRTYELPAGTHKLILREPRYKEVALDVTIEAGETTTVRQHLEALAPAMPPFGKLKTSAPGKYTGVFVNNAFMGHTDEFDNFAQGLLLNPGEYVVRLTTADGSQSHEEKVTIREDETTLVEWDGR